MKKLLMKFPEARFGFMGRVNKMIDIVPSESDKDVEVKYGGSYEILELDVLYNGFKYKTILGKGKSWWIAIPNWRVSEEISHPSDSDYNTTKLAGVLPSGNMARAIATGVAKYWEAVS